METADRVLLALAETVGNRLREDNVQIEVVSVGIKYKDLSYFSIRKCCRQPTLFDEIDYDKLERLDKIVDSLRKRYGMDSIMGASFIKEPIDHISGGISREKRTVDYDRITIE